MRFVAAALVTVLGLAGLAIHASRGHSAAWHPVTRSDLAARGRKLYYDDSCRGCHTIDGKGNAGPTFKHLYGRRVKLRSGKTVTANDAYLLRSIMNPNADIVATYLPNVMTMVIRKGTVPRTDALALVAFIKSLR